MSWREYLALAVLGLLMLLVVAYFQTTPGYMDAEYYFSGGRSLNAGEGFEEWILWNYLDDPQSLPHPSHAYWMPLASIVTWLGMLLTRSHTFSAGRLGFLLIAGCIPPLTAALAYRLMPKRASAWLAGLLAVFPVYYLPYLPTSDTFAIYMLLGICWLWLAAGYPLILQRFLPDGKVRMFFRLALLGVVSGLMHLARADGLVWLLLALGSIIIWRDERKAEHTKVATPTATDWKTILLQSSSCLLGYLLIMAPWMTRNLAEFGSLLAPGGMKSLWFIDYNDLYAYPAGVLTIARWWSTGLSSILQTRLWALGQNLQTLLAVQWMIILAPLIIWGLWRCRTERVVRIGLVALFSILFLMTVIFPFAGARGGFFHSGAALQPLYWALAPVGLQAFVEWGGRARGWKPKAWRVFAAATLAGVIMLSVIVVNSRVLGADWRQPVWGASHEQYVRLGQALDAIGASSQDVVLVNNPPGFYLAAGKPAAAIPNGGPDILLAAAEKYNARFIILEGNHPPGLDDLYQQPASHPGMHYVETIAGAHLIEIFPD